MNIVYTDKLKGIISSITSDDVAVPFHENMGPALYYKENGKKKLLSLRQVNGIYIAISHGVQFSLEHIIKEDCLTLRVDIYNNSDKAFMPEAIGLCLGIDSYMVEYPQWNNRFFPTYMRCEKTHFIGYFMSPQQKAVAVVCKQPVAAWELEYNTASYGSETDCHFGHRIYTGNLLLTVNGKVPKRHPQDLRGINAGENKSWEVNLIPLNDIKKFKPMLTERFDMPVISCEMYTVAKGEKIKPEIMCGEEYSVNIISPSGKIIKSEKITADEYGVYTVTVKSKNGKICEAKIYCRHDYGWYLKAARKNAVYKPQKATTHTESWYGHFSNFLAKKHYPDTRLDTLAKQNFDEIMPLMYDFENGKALIAPDRVQNEALLISLLTDAFEAEGEEKYLDYANNMAQELMSRQADSGAYMSGNTHYTSVIYIAKSMLELADCEKKLADKKPEYAQRYEVHYHSAARAVCDLKNLRERIGTEGEHTLEDGMITCSALQLAYYALTLEKSERQEFIEAAEYLISLHRCLEDNETPDCRTNGGTLRFWEAQYDVMFRGNMFNTPHGWTSWKTYATYYLYLLTGREEYLKKTINTMGACLQMIDENENLRWAFVKDPYLNLNVFIPDITRPIKDGYTSVPEDIEQAYGGKFEKRVFGEEYVDMISGWYRTGEQRITGGYRICPLVYADHNEYVDNQGGACDNDVHEHFKCLEEILLKKVFVIVDEEVRGYNCSAQLQDGILTVVPYGECKYIHVNTCIPLSVRTGTTVTNIEKGMYMLSYTSNDDI